MSPIRTSSTDYTSPNRAVTPPSRIPTPPCITTCNHITCNTHSAVASCVSPTGPTFAHSSNTKRASVVQIQHLLFSVDTVDATSVANARAMAEQEALLLNMTELLHADSGTDVYPPTPPPRTSSLPPACAPAAPSDGFAAAVANAALNTTARAFAASARAERRRRAGKLQDYKSRLHLMVKRGELSEHVQVVLAGIVADMEKELVVLRGVL